MRLDIRAYLNDESCATRYVLHHSHCHCLFPPTWSHQGTTGAVLSHYSMVGYLIGAHIAVVMLHQLAQAVPGGQLLAMPEPNAPGPGC